MLNFCTLTTARIVRKACRFGILITALVASSLAAIQPGNVLVIYNSQDATSLEIKNYYQSKRSGVLSFDLNDASLGPGSISYADFAQKIRDPIRNHLNNNNLEQTVQVLVLTKNLPHRIQGLDPANPNIGDNANASLTLYTEGKANFASVDSELTLLQFDLNDGENNGAYDSFADNPVYNPYYNDTSPFSSYSRSRITSNRRNFFTLQVSTDPPISWWRLHNTFGAGLQGTAANAGHIYLTARLDAATLQTVKDMIDRAQDIQFRRDIDALLLDSDGASNFDFNDYSNAYNSMISTWGQTTWNNNGTFLVGNASSIPYSPTQVTTGPVAYLHSYGVNHSGGNQRDYLLTYAGQLVPGAAFSAYESFGAKGLGGLSNSSQGQVEEWFDSGGTFATGPVWEPLTFGISRSQIFLDRFLKQGFTFVEAAWASIQQISWQTVVIGDPLATANISLAEPYELWIFSQSGVTPDVNTNAAFSGDLEADGIKNGIEYLLGLNPGQSEIPATELPSLNINDKPEFSFVVDNDASANLIVTVKMRTNLDTGDWITIATRSANGSWSGSATITETNTAGGISVTVRDESTETTNQRFYQLEAQLNP